MGTTKTKAAGGNQTALRGTTARDFKWKDKKNQKPFWYRKFQKKNLPNAAAYYTKHLKGLVRRPGSDWASALCPLHGDSKASLLQRAFMVCYAVR